TRERGGNKRECEQSAAADLHVDDQATGEGGCGEGTDSCECHLTEGELSRPSREHRERERADRIGGYRRVEQVSRGLGDDERQGDGTCTEQKYCNAIDVPYPPHVAK